MTQLLDSLKEGDQIMSSGPRGKYEYKGNGEFFFKNLKFIRSFQKVSFIAGGSGITPIYQLLNNLKKSDQTKWNLLFANKSEEDILLESNLQKLQKKIPTLKISFTLEKPTASWKSYIGYVSDQMINENIPLPDEEDDHLIFVCGPKAMNEFVKDKLLRLGYPETNIFFY